MLVYSFGSFLLQDMFSSLQVFALMIQKVDRPNTTPIGQDKDTLTIQKVDRPNTTPICQDKNTLTFKALLERVRLLKTSLFCMKAVEGLYRSLLVEAGFLLNAIYS